MDEDEYPSDSDQSDEDYCPDDRQAENLSEVDSDDNIDDVDDAETNDKNSDKKRKSSKKSNKAKKSTDKQTDDKAENVESATATEDAEEDKSRADALWADFLSGTDPLPTKKPEQKKAEPIEVATVRDNIKPETVKEPPKKLVTQIFDFAGEKVEITKEIEETATNEKPDGKSSGPSNGIGRRPPLGGLKRSGGGIGSVLGQLTKKNKISVLDKSKHDWDSFKRNEGIDEQLQTHNRGRDGYLDRQDFLDRTDVRQFEIEKSIRLSKRTSRH